MTIYTLNLLIAVLALGVTIILYFIRKPENLVIDYIKNFLGTFFVFSGTVKAIDPIGTSIKITEYFEIFGEYMPFLASFWHFMAELALPVSIFTIVLEIALGFSLILGTFKRSTLFLYAGLIIFFTVLTGFSTVTGKVTDCGCFGDFVKLKPFESFIKDVFLSVLVLIMVIFHKHIKYLFKKMPSTLALSVLTLIALIFTLRNYYDLPIVDFRAYKKGTNLIEGRNDGIEAEVVKYYTLKNEAGETKEVSDKEYIDSGIWKDKSWTLEKDLTKEKILDEGKPPTIKDFFIFNQSEEEVQDDILAKPGYHFFVASHNIAKSDKDAFKRVNKVMSDAKQAGISAIGLTATGISEANPMTDGAYEFYNLDATPIKTMIRGNPGVVLIKDGVVVDKWHGNSLPDWSVIKGEYGM